MKTCAFSYLKIKKAIVRLEIIQYITHTFHYSRKMFNNCKERLQIILPLKYGTYRQTFENNCFKGPWDYTINKKALKNKIVGKGRSYLFFQKAQKINNSKLFLKNLLPKFAFKGHKKMYYVIHDHLNFKTNQYWT